MPDYRAPIRDIQFVMNELLDSETFYQALPKYSEVDEELLNAIVDEGAKFSETVLSPLNRTGDEEGCKWEDGVVTTPKGFTDAYQQYVENGWPALTAPEETGGQDMPNLLDVVMNELIGTANWSWSMYPGLSQGAVRTLEQHGSEEQKKTFLVPLTSGRWTGTMCLTEAHCGTDLGLLKTRAEPQADGSYKITGTKIFISAGEHDMAENIVHIVLARLPDAPPRSKGISLFIVPKFLADESGGIAERNSVRCGSIEKKMGIKASATCVMNFDDATGYLVGEANKGLAHMFTFMNAARLGTAVQGLAHGQLSYQGALKYAHERLQMRSLSGPKNPEGDADPIIVHPDVRRMLLTQKAFSEGGRAFLYYLGQVSDLVECGSTEDKQRAENLLALLTPIAKAFITETGFESANLGMQVYGGHGFIREWGMEQIVRDARIAMLYEGTTGIQALDLIGRKVLGSGGKLLEDFTTEVLEFCSKHEESEVTGEYINTLRDGINNWLSLTGSIGEMAMQNPEEAGAAAVDYLMYCGYVTLGYFWARMAVLSDQKLSETEDEFYRAKLHTAKFYFERIYPRTTTLKETMLSGADNLMSLDQESFQF